MSIDKYLEQFGDKTNTEYLGDGAYVGFTGYSYILFTTNGITVQNEVHLEGNEIKVLNRFIEKMKEKYEST
jgi:hypothetical protein